MDKQLQHHLNGPLKADTHGLKIYGVTATGESIPVLDVRAWGYLTGGAALNLPESEAIAEQERFQAEIVHKFNAYDRLTAENKRLREAFFFPDRDRRRWYLCDLIARVGHFNRADLCGAFGISVPQASLDIKRLMEEFPALLTYNKSAKRYERPALSGEAGE